MTQGWRVEIWGVRGSFPRPEADFLHYGGNTCCITVDTGDALVVLDAGSGLARLGETLLRQGRKRADIFISHPHLDHVMGLFPFVPRYDRTWELHLYGMPGLAGELTRLVGPPLWPVDLADGRGQVRIHEVWDGKSFSLAEGAAPGLTAAVLEGDHPGGCFYYRLEGRGRSLVYALDCGLERPDAVSRLTGFARGADLLVWDASFAPGRLKAGWGHSTWRQGLELGRAAGVGAVLMTHYDWSYDDSFLAEQEALAAQESGLCRFAREGMVMEL